MSLQDPEGILAQPRGGHIQRRTLQKQIAEDKELQEQVDKKEAEMREELQRKRDVSMLCPTMRASCLCLSGRTGPVACKGQEAAILASIHGGV